MARVNLTYSSAIILQALASGHSYGFDVMDVTGMPSGTVYPALRRLERARLIRARWEDEDVARREQRPARKYYQMTQSGIGVLGEAVRRYHLLERLAGPPLAEPKTSRA